MSCRLGSRALGALAICYIVIVAVAAPVLLGYSHVSAQAKPDGGHGRTTAGGDQYIVIPVTGLPDKMIWTVAFDPKDRPWVGTNGGGATQQDDGTWRWLTTANGLASGHRQGLPFPP
jgi:hypothetical protein